MRADWDVDGIAARGRIRSVWPAVGIPLLAVSCAIGVALISLGGTRWEVVGLLGALAGTAVAAWLLLYRRFLNATLVLLTMTVPVLIDVELVAPHGWSFMTGWPQGFALRLSDIFLAIAALAWFVDLTLLRGRETERLGWASTWLFVLIGAALLFPVHSPEPLSAFIDWTKLVRYAAVFALLAKRLDDRSLLKWVVLGIAAQVWVEALISTVQYATGSSLGLEFLGERGSIKSFATDEGANPRAGGLMGHPNNLALFLVLVGPLILAKLLTVPRLGARLGWGATYVALNVALLLTFSRLGWVCSVLSFFAVYHLIRSRAGQPLWLSLGLPLFTTLVVFIVLFVGVDSFRERLLSDDRGSTESRIEQFKTAFSIIAHWPLAGTGIGSYVDGAVRFAAGQGRSVEQVVMRVHNGSLLVAAELGLLGALAYHGWFFVVMRRGFAAWRYVDDELAAIGTGVFIGLAAWFAKSMYNAHTPLVDSSVWLFAALSIVIARFAARSAPDQGASTSARVRPMRTSSK